MVSTKSHVMINIWQNAPSALISIRQQRRTFFIERRNHEADLLKTCVSVRIWIQMVPLNQIRIQNPIMDQEG